MIAALARALSLRAQKQFDLVRNAFSLVDGKGVSRIALKCLEEIR